MALDGMTKLYPKYANESNVTQWAQEVLNLNCKTASKDFNVKMKRYHAPEVTFDTCMMEKNLAKSRYADVICIDQTRVVLKNRGKDNDFIHANWVSIHDPGATRYICTQAPLQETQEDFWHMCLTEKVSLILMLCDFKEGSEMEKCSHYFPENVNQTLKIGDYEVTMRKQWEDPEIEQTKFSTMEIKCKEDTFLLTHCSTTYWIDNCAPVDTAPVLKLHRWIRKNHDDRPVVVHCSAGLGRAGTMVALELAIHRIGKNPDIYMMDIVRELRKHRDKAVDSHVHFLYLHYLVLDFFVGEGLAEPYANSVFVEEFRRHTKKRTDRAMKLAKKNMEQPQKKEEVIGPNDP